MQKTAWRLRKSSKDILSRPARRCVRFSVREILQGEDNSPDRVEDWSHQLTLLPHWQQTTDNWQLFVSPVLPAPLPGRVVIMGRFQALKRRAEPSSPYGAWSLDIPGTI